VARVLRAVLGLLRELRGIVCVDAFTPRSEYVTFQVAASWPHNGLRGSRRGPGCNASMMSLCRTTALPLTLFR